MKAHNPIDDMFQQHFAEATIPMNNQEELWARISEKKDDKRRGFFWVVALGLAFCVVVGYGIINLNNSTSQNIVSSELANTSIINTVSNNIETNQIALSDTENEDEITGSAVIEEEAKSRPLDIDSELTVSSELGSQKKEIINTPILNNVSDRVDFLSSNLNNSINYNQQTHSSVDQKISSGAIGGLIPIESEEQLADLGFKESKEIIRAVFDLEVLDILKSDLKLYNNTPPLFDQSDSWSRCEVKTSGHFFVDIYGQAGLPMDKIDFTQEGSDQTAYRDLWDTRFDPAASWHGGAQIGYEMRNGLRISAGAEYQEIVTEYSDNQQITETIRVYDPQAYFTIDGNGDRVWVGDTVTAINIYERKFVRKNTHTLLHIPLQFSYDIYRKPGLHVALDVATALNVSKTYEGQYIRSDQTLIMVDENNQDNYISKDIGLSFSAGLHVGKYLNDNWEIYLSPRFRYNPNSYLLDTETLKITRNMIGLRGGVRYHF